MWLHITLDVVDKNTPGRGGGLSVLKNQSVWPSKCGYVFNKFRLITHWISLLHLCNSCLYSSMLVKHKRSLILLEILSLRCDLHSSCFGYNLNGFCDELKISQVIIKLNAAFVWCYSQTSRSHTFPYHKGIICLVIYHLFPSKRYVHRTVQLHL